MAVSFNSYYLYKKYEKRANQPWLPVYPETFSIDADGTMPKVLKTSGDPACYEPQERWVDTGEYACEVYYDPIYRWVTVVGGYECSGTTKMTQEKEQVSYNSGSTWLDVSPLTTRPVLPVIEYNSEDCAYIPPQYRWTASGWTCVGYDKYQNNIKEQSIDGGATWTVVTPVEYSASTLIEASSTDCGWSPSLYNAKYLTFIARENCEFATFSNSGVEYSEDNGLTWKPFNPSQAMSVAVASGNSIILKGSLAGEHQYGYQFFRSAGEFDIEGNIMSLIYGDDFIGKTTVPDGAPLITFGTNVGFGGAAHIVNAKNLILPATGNTSYEAMFNGCSSLVTAPHLPITTLWSPPSSTLSRGCYELMFARCTSLVTAPKLPATTLAPYCYYGMFLGCTSLTVPPELSVTTLVDSCYMSMFSGCTSLTNAPTLPARTLVDDCYRYMFENCTSLSAITCFATTFGHNSTLEWVSNVKPSGTFTKANSASWGAGVSGIPNGWTVINNASQ